MTKVSVIIPTYNRGRYVTKAIDSVLAQTYKDYEIIVVDDGSTDNTRDILASYRDKIRCIYQENMGASAARNTGIRASTGEWIAFLDSDDEWLPDKLSIQMADISARPDLCAHITNVTFILPNGGSVSLFEVRNFEKYSGDSFVIGRPFLYVLNYGIAVMSSFVVRRDDLFNAGLFDTKISVSVDKDLFLRVALQGKWGCSCVELVKYYRRDEPGVSVTRKFGGEKISRYESAVYILDKIKNNLNLDKEEKHFLVKSLSSWIFQLGIQQQKIGCEREARANFIKSLSINRSWKSLIRYLLTLFPEMAGIMLYEKWRFRKGMGFHI